MFTTSAMPSGTVLTENNSGRIGLWVNPSSCSNARPPTAILPIPPGPSSPHRHRLHDPRAATSVGATSIVTSGGRGSAAGMTATTAAPSPRAVGGSVASPALHRHHVVIVLRVLPTSFGISVPPLSTALHPSLTAHVLTAFRHPGKTNRSMRPIATSEANVKIGARIPNIIAASDEPTQSPAPLPAPTIPSFLSIPSSAPIAFGPLPVPPPASPRPQHRHQGPSY